MISLEVCIAFWGLTEEVLALAEHEHISEIVSKFLKCNSAVMAPQAGGDMV